MTRFAMRDYVDTWAGKAHVQAGLSALHLRWTESFDDDEEKI